MGLALWIGVHRRFQRFYSDLLLTPDQTQDGMTKQLGVRQKLEQVYYGQSSEAPPGFLVGSWGKSTQVRPPRDLDLFFILPPDVFTRFDGRAGNKQSALLQEVKEALQDKYVQSDLRGDGQVVLIAFNTIDVEIIPVFAIANNQFVMPDANGGGRWKIVDPLAQIALIHATDQQTSGNTRALARMMKQWTRHYNVPIKSFIIELLVTYFMKQYHNSDKSFFWYDWMVRDFLSYLCGLRNGTLTLPGTGDVIQVGDDWGAKAQSSLTIALSACDMEYNDWTILAGEEWQKIFGTRIPVYMP
jgi:Second Messenger Oligonucleotide or Dinucleotide Synthetase domain